MPKKYFFIILSAAIIFGAAFYIFGAKAGAGENSIGWLWGGTDDGAGNNAGVGWISMNNLSGGGGAVSYGVNIPSSNGPLSGYAWSENIGWINFAPPGPYPAVSTGDDYAFAAQRVGDKLKGWARISGIQTEFAAGNSGGWLGWIRLHSDANDLIQYGIKLNSDGTITKGQTTSYAWSNELGWIDFSRARTKMNVVPTLIISGPAYVPLGGQRTYYSYYDPDGSGPQAAIDVTGLSVWSSSNSSIAQISGPGIVNGVKPGPAVIYAEYVGLTASLNIDVADIPNIYFDASKKTIISGATTTLMWSVTSDPANVSCGASSNPNSDWIGPKPTNGNQDIAISKTTAFTLTCVNSLSGFSNSASVTVKVWPKIIWKEIAP